MAAKPVRPVATLLALACVVLAACQAGPGPGKGAQRSAPEDCSPPPLQRADFPQLPRIDNRFRPLTPGMQFQLDGVVVGVDGVRHPHRIETTVTELTKRIDGVNTLAVFERDFHDGRITESELAFMAQDNHGAVWNLGEYPEVYDGDTLLGAPSAWLSGVGGARPGIELPGTPRVGDAAFAEGVAPNVNFKDCAFVFQTGQRVCVGEDCHDGVLVVDEFAPASKKEGHQRKFYAPGLGTVKVAAAGGVDAEELQLTRAAKLCRGEFIELQAAALAQDARAFQVAKDVYAGYPAAKQTLTAQLCG